MATKKLTVRDLTIDLEGILLLNTALLRSYIGKDEFGDGELKKCIDIIRETEDRCREYLRGIVELQN